MTANGLSMAYTTDAYRTCDKMRVNIAPILLDGEVLFTGGTFDTPNASSGTINIPFEQLEFMPEEGAEVAVSVSFEPLSRYISESTTRKTIEITYSGGDLKPVVNISQVDDYTVSFTISEQTGRTYNTEHASFIYEHDGKAVIHTLTKENGVYTLATPLNKEYHIFVEIANKSGSTYTS